MRSKYFENLRRSPIVQKTYPVATEVCVNHPRDKSSPKIVTRIYYNFDKLLLNDNSSNFPRFNKLSTFRIDNPYCKKEYSLSEDQSSSLRDHRRFLAPRILKYGRVDLGKNQGRHTWTLSAIQILEPQNGNHEICQLIGVEQ